MKLRIIIIDDEADAIEAIESIIEINSKDYEIVAKTTEPVKGLGLILQYKPDVVFLDIEMPGMNGLQLMESIPSIDLEVIFTTAYEHYAISAIKANALDYILKPVSIPEVINALEKVKKKKQNSISSSENYNNLITEIKSHNNCRVKIPTLKGFDYIEIENLIYLEADGSYTTAFFRDSRKLVISKSIKQIEPLLNKYNFFRVHRSFIVNVNYIRRFDREKNSIFMIDNSAIPLSRRRHDAFMAFLKKIDE